MRKKATSVRLSPELLRRVREITPEAASITGAIEIVLKDGLNYRARVLAGWRDRYPTQTAMMLFQPGADWRSIDPAATELYDMLVALPEALRWVSGPEQVTRIE
jgi:hypothetical protein